MIKSCIYEGTIRHRRHLPRGNKFRYRLFFMLLDLDELPTLFDIHPLWSGKEVNLAYFRRRDHFGDPKVPMKQAAQDLVEERLGRRPDGPIRLLTHLRYFGHCFNPASFYFCYNKADTEVETIILEVHNTPWGEHFCYVLDKKDDLHPFKDWRRHTGAKVFHVSPFIDMDIHYDWRFRLPGDNLVVHIIDYQKDRKLFDATLKLKRRAINRQELTRLLLLYPALTVKVVILIYWQALRLILKKTPFYAHP